MKTMEINLPSKPRTFLVPTLLLTLFLMTDSVLAGSGPGITTQPQNQTNLWGSNATFSVVAGGQTPLFYQWTFSGTNLVNNSHVSGATNTSLTISNVSLADMGNYQVVVTNSHGSVTSSNATLTVLSPPNVVTQPTNKATYFGASVSFSVSVTGTSPLSYRWYFNSAQLSDNSQITGSGNAVLNIAGVKAANVGNYQVIVTNNYGAATSVVVALTATNRTFYVNLNNPSPVPPYVDWSTAATNVQDAVDLAASGDRIFVTNGIYSFASRVISVTTNCVVSTNAVLISSVSGPAQTVIDGSGKNRCVYLAGGATLTGFTLTNGATVENGAGACCASTNESLLNCVFMGNNAGGNSTGGGAYLGTLINCTLANNSSASGGGAGASVMSNCLVSANIATNGGGIAYGTLYNCTISNNNTKAYGYAGGAYSSTLSDCLLAGNNSFYGGGGAGYCTLFGCMLSNNITEVSYTSGGGADSSTLSNCVVVGNTAFSNGGGANNCTIVNSLILSNAAPWGGGVDNCTLTNCVLKGNLANDIYTGGGGGAYSSSLFNCLVVENSSYYFGGGAYQSTLINCTVARNSAYQMGGGTYTSWLTNCINYYNSAYVDNNSEGSGMGWCCTAPLFGSFSGISNIDSAPLFVDMANGNYRLYPGSPCIEAGYNAAVPVSADLDGNSRLVNGTVDIGAYEFQNSPFIEVQPTNQTLPFGLPSASFSVVAVGPGTLTYQWMLNGTNIQGATNATLTFYNLQYSQSGIYAVQVMNSFGTLTSSNAMLTVVPPTPPSFAIQPSSAFAPLRTNLTLTALATGAPDPAYQWYFNGVALSDNGHYVGTATTNLQIFNVHTNDGGNFYVIATNVGGAATSSVAMVTVLLPVPVITNQPANQYVLLGASAVFTVGAGGDTPFGYSWYYNGAPLSDGGRLSGAGTSVLTIQNVQSGDVGSYQVVITNIWGATTSTVASLNLATIRYVNVSNAAPVSPYTNWATAAATIQDAINAAGPGDEIIVTNGIYQNLDYTSASGYAPDRIALIKPVSVISVNGPAVTQILGGPSYSAYGRRCAYLTNGAVLAGFTLSSGRVDFSQTRSDDQMGGGVLCASSSAIVSNCVITGNFSGHNGGGAYSGTLVNCVIAHNQAVNLFYSGVGEGAGAYAANLTNCVVINNNANVQGGGAVGGTLVNCLIASNSATLGGGASGSSLFNCTVVGNSAATNGSGGGVFGSTAANSIIASNTAASGGQDNYGNSIFSYSCTTPDPGGLGNITDDPELVDYTGNNYRLKTGSPCINTGANGYLTVSADLDGHPRVVDGTVDMGAYEYQHAPWFLSGVPNQRVLAGSNFSLTMPALGDSPAYQWWFNGTPLTDVGRITGSASGVLTVALSQTNDSGSYWVTASNSFGMATSSVATVSVLLPILITAQPTNVTASLSNTATFTVTATGYIPPAFLWYSNGVPLTNGGRIGGASSATLTILNVQAGDSGSIYQVVLTNNYGSVTSSLATLTVLLPVQITGQPASEAVLLGGNANFTVSASGSAPSYQWYFNGQALSDGGRVSGSASPTLNIGNVQAGDAGGYFAIVSNPSSAATSRVASLTPQAILAPSIRFVNLSNTAPASPYLSWSTAATNIQDAVDASIAGDTVLVSNGTYRVGGRIVYGAEPNRVVVDKAVIVQSVNGATATTILGYAVAGAFVPGRCVYLTNGASLIGFTLNNGNGTRTGNPILEMSGGGVWCEPGSVVISNCTVTGNQALGMGGGIFRGTLFNCLVASNTAAQGGGACSNTLINSTIAMNSASFQNVNSGGGAYGCTLSNCLVVGNRCPGGGGGAYASTMTSCVVSNNTGSSGGGVSLGSINNCLISSNRATQYGGGAYSNTVSNCTFANNQAEFGGAAAYSTLSHCVAAGNRAQNYGGAVYLSAADNCVIASNTASMLGTAVYGSTLTSCTVVSNFTPGTASIAAVYGGGITNCIVFDNSGGNINSSSKANVAYTCTTPLIAGSGNITNAPLFVNETAGDFHLQSSSPCINSGNDAFVVSSTDFDGNPRIQGGTVDMGAYEYQTPSSVLSYAYLQQYGLPTDGSVDYLDLDGTGMNNWQKWIAGLNPTNPASVLVMVPVPSTNTSAGVKVSWMSVSNRTYYLQRATDLSAQPAFTAIHSNLTGQAGITIFTDATATNGGPYFYRVGVQ